MQQILHELHVISPWSEIIILKSDQLEILFSVDIFAPGKL